MAISDQQKIDYLFKKIGYGKAKTDVNSNKFATNEAINSPLLIRGDKIWAQSDQIPSANPKASEGVVTFHEYLQTSPDSTASANRSWLTGYTDWITPEFGATYQVSVYAAAPGLSDPTVGTRLFASGSGNNDEWFFDYQAGVLNFIGDNLPASLDGTAVIYVTGCVYTGQFGTITQEGVQGYVDSTYIKSFIDSDYIDLFFDQEQVLALIPDATERGVRYYSFIAEDDQLNFTAEDYYGRPLIYTAQSIIVFFNGVMLLDSIDYTATDGRTVTLTEPAKNGDTLVVYAINAGGLDEVEVIDILDQREASGIDAANLKDIIDPDTDLDLSNILDTFNKDTFRSVKYFVQLEDRSNNKYHFTEIVLLHNDSIVSMSEYGVITTDSELGQFDATIVGNEVRLLCTAEYPNITIKSKRISNGV